MKFKNYFLSLVFLLIAGIMNAQPDEKYIHKITGDVHSEWLMKAGNSAPSQSLNWTYRMVHGFKNVPLSGRQQAVLSQPWAFFKIDSDQGISESSSVMLPHNFERNRAYKSGWYITKYKLNKLPKKRMVLMLNRVELFSMVYVNGKRIGKHFGSYTPFEFDITDALVSGDNVLAIFVYDQSAALDGNKVYNQVGVTYLSRSNENGPAVKLPGGLHDIPVLELREKATINDVFVKTSTRKGEMEIEYTVSSVSSISSKSKLTFELFKWPAGEKVELEIPTISAKKMEAGINSFKVKWTNADLWSPDHPNLYVLRTIFQNGSSKDVLDTRFGFREFWTEGKSFMLNGLPIRLRGESHYRNSDSDPGFHSTIFKLHKETFGSNTCRIHATMPPGDIMLGADEAGMLLINQSAIWSVNGQYYLRGGDWFLKNTEREFEEWVKRDRNSPSVVIWDIENEMLRFNVDTHLPWISQLPDYIKKFDTTRPINCSGAGWYSPNQDMVSLHMQEHYTRIMSDWNKKGTTPLITGEFWVGGRSDQRLPNSPELSSVHERNIDEARSYEDKILEMRYMGLSGIMPFRISLLSFSQIQQSPEKNKLTSQVKLEVKKQPEDVLQIIRHCLQPVTTFFWPRQSYVEERKIFRRELVVCNDSENENSFEVNWKWANKTAKSKSLILRPSEQQRITIEEDAPDIDMKLIATVSCNNVVFSSDTILITPFKPSVLASTKMIQVYKDEKLAKTLTAAGFKSFSSDKIPTITDQVLWIIPEHANNRELNIIKDQTLAYLNAGGNILCLKQDQAPTWFPMKFNFSAANQSTADNYDFMGWEGLNKDLFFSTVAPIYATSHPIFKGLNSTTLNSWDKFDRRVCDDVFARPSETKKFEQGNWRTLSGGTRREQVSLAEFFYGKGIMLSCQLNVIDNLDNIQAKCLFTNMINYLADKKTSALTSKISVKGNMMALEITSITGVSEPAFQGATAQNNDLMIAFEGANPSDIKAWANAGGKAVVFSNSLSQAFEGVKYSSDKGKQYIATKTADHPLLYGVSSANFLDYEMITGYFSSIPSSSKVLLQGFSGMNTFWKIEDAGPVMISIPYGKGEIILSTIEISKNPGASARELLSLIFTNAGVEIPFSKLVSDDEIIIKKTVPITIDGKLNEWLEDMEDRLVTPYIHAQPVYLTSENIVEGPHGFDLNLSAIDYFLWNEQALHVAGVVFMEKRFFGSESYPGDKAYTQKILFNDDVITVSVRNKVAEITVNGKTLPLELVKTSQLESKKMTDATRLQFNYIHASGKLEIDEKVVGETFELMIPWELLKSKASDEKARAFISLQSNGSKIQVPLNGSSSSQENWLKMKFKTTKK